MASDTPDAQTANASPASTTASPAEHAVSSAEGEEVEAVTAATSMSSMSARNQARGQRILTETPVLKLLLGSNTSGMSRDAVVKTISQAIQDRINAHPEIILQGRTCDLFRSDYDAANHDITGIRRRLTSKPTSGGSDAELEFLLNPLVKWNKAPFPQLSQQHLMPYQNSNGLECYRSQWVYRQQVLHSIRPIDRHEREKVVRDIKSSVRARCYKVDRDSLLLLKPKELTYDRNAQRMTSGQYQHAVEWNLSRQTVGFGAKLMACFDGLERTSEE